MGNDDGALPADIREPCEERIDNPRWPFERPFAQCRIRAISAVELTAREFPLLEPILTPWLFQKNLCMVHAKRGVGKSHFAMGCAFAIASGGSYLGYKSAKPRRVLYIDGEMPVQLMQKRIRELASSAGEVPELLSIVTPDLQESAMFDLATREGQREVDALLQPDTSVIVIDNLSCLVRSGGAENEAESWGCVSQWALRQRRAGRSVLFVHHSGKSGMQRGTSKREDVLDVVINLRRPAEYQEAEGAVFTVHFEKARSLTGDDFSPIEARLKRLDNGNQAWSSRPLVAVTASKIITLWNLGGLTIVDIARELGVNKSTVARDLQKAQATGQLKRHYPPPRGRKSDSVLGR